MIEQVVRYLLPAAFSVLPTRLGTIEAAALLTVIGLQESRFLHRTQTRGPARGFWQFEMAGVVGVHLHPHASQVLRNALVTLRYPPELPPADLYQVIEHNDVLAAVLARCLLLTHPDELPRQDLPDTGWRIYLATWRPGKPCAYTWGNFWREGWDYQVRPAGPGLSTPIKA